MELININFKEFKEEVYRDISRRGKKKFRNYEEKL